LPVVGFALVLSITSIGCGGDEENGTEPTSPPGSRAVLEGRVTLKGAIAASGAYDTTYSSATGADCASFADRSSSGSDQVSFVIPMPTTLGEHRLSWAAVIRPYRGPATYQKDTLPRLAGAALGADGKVRERYVSSSATKASVTVKDDGSGSFTFSDLGTGARRLSGTARWTCRDG
jgi:hypothetical protein